MLYSSSVRSDLEDAYRTECLMRFAPLMTPEGFREGFLRCLVYAHYYTKDKDLPDGRTGDDLVHDVLLRHCLGSPLPCGSVEGMLTYLRPRIRREAWRAWRKTDRRPVTESLADD